jgi:hypothetical protein
VRHRWWFIISWAVIAVAIVALAGALDGQFSDNFRIPHTQSQEALDLLQRDFPKASGDNALVVFEAPQGIDNASVEAAIAPTVTALGKLPHVTSVTDPYGPEGSAFISKSGDIAVVTVQFDTKAQDLPDPKQLFDRFETATAPATKAGVKVAYGGAVIDYIDQPPNGNADLIGLLAAVIILLFAFGSVVAMGLPILTAVFGLAVGISVVHVIASFTEIGTVAPVLATMIGLGVGIDYSLFIVTRYRENLATGLDVEAAVGRSVATAGSAVLFAGTTVVIAICGLALSGIPYVARLGYMSGIVVAVMMLAALTLLPAIIGAVGHGIDRWKVPSLIHHPDRAVREGRDPEVPAGTVWERWANLVARHAWPFALLAVAILLAIAWPVLSMRLGESDDGNLPTSTTQRQAYDLVAQGFGPGTNGPLLVVVQLPAPGQDAVLATVTSALEKTPGIKAVLPAQTSPNGQVAQIGVLPTTAPDSAQTSALVADLRGSVLPAAIGTTGAHAYVGGRRWRHRGLHRHRRPRQQPAPLLHRRGGAAVLHPLDARVPLHTRAAHRRGDEPAVGRGRLRRDRRRVPVGVGEGPRRPREHRAHRAVRADDDVRGAVRALDGLPGVPAHARARGVRPHRRHASGRGARTRPHGARDHLGSPHHDLRVRCVRAEPHARGEDVRARPGVRSARRRDDRAHDPRAVDHGDPRRRQLVVPEVARLLAPPRHRRRSLRLRVGARTAGTRARRHERLT